MGAVTMATTYNRVGSGLVRAAMSGDLRFIPITFTMSNSYATNGDTGVTVPTFSGTLVTRSLFPSHRGYDFRIDTANNKMQAYTNGAEVSSTTDLSGLGAITCFMVVKGP